MGTFRSPGIKVRRLPLQIKILVFTMTLALGPLLVSGYISQMTARGIMLDEKRNDLQVHTEDIDAAMDSVLEDRLGDVVAISHDPVVAAVTADPLAPQPRERALAFLQSVMLMHPNISTVCLVDTSSGTVSLSATGNEGQYLGNRQFVKAAAAGEAYISGPARDGGHDLLYFSTPLKLPSGSIPMVMVMASKAEDIWAPLSRETNQLGEGSVTTLTDEFGVRIGHSSNLNLVYTSWAPLPEETRQALLKEQRYGADITEIGATDYGEFAATLTKPDPPTHVTEHRLAVGDSLYESALIQCSLKPWVVMESIPHAAFLEPVNQIKQDAAFIIILTVLVLIAASIYVGRFAAKPINTLVSSVETMEAGDLSSPVPEIVDREMSKLADRFESMRQKVVGSREDLERGYIDIAKALVASLEARDPYTGGHTERVSQYALALARKMEMDDTEIGRIKRAADLHDIGKIAVPDAVLLKPDKLTPGEFAEIKRHPTKSGEIVHYLDFLRDVVPYIEGHHERFDGTGYPRGLKGADIPLGARILAVADAYDAMTSKRAYREALSHDRALAILQQGSGTQWDPDLVEVFLEIIGTEQGEHDDHGDNR